MPVPCPVSISEKIKFKLVACGAYHTMALSDLGEPYACGLVSSGRLGLTEQQAKESMKSSFEFAFQFSGSDDDKVEVLNLYQLTKVPLPSEIQG